MTNSVKRTIGFLFCLIFCMAIAVGAPQVAEAAENVAIDEAHFPDAAFRKRITTDCDSNKDGILSVQEMNNVKSFYVSFRGIKNLKGIEYLTALTFLDCSDNKLTSLDVSNNTALTELRCCNNKLTSLNVSNNTALQRLYCFKNELTSLNVSNNTALILLFCYKNELTSLDLSKNTMLRRLDCGFNCLTDLNLNLNPLLSYLVCNDNKLTSLDLSENTNLDRLVCDSNQFTELRLNSRTTYNRSFLFKYNLHGTDNVSLSDLRNITVEDDEILHVIDITKPATYKVDGKDFTIIYADSVIPDSGDSTNPAPDEPVDPTPAPDEPVDPAPAPDEPIDLTPAFHFYEDYDSTKQATNSTIQIYANGGTVTDAGTGKKVNHKRCVLYTDILPSYIYTVGKNGVVKPSDGKIVVGITFSAQKPELVRGKIVDKDASKIASASIKNGQITVTAKSQPGNVYLWVVDTGRAAAAACIPVTVKGAPTATSLYAVPDTDPSFIYGKTKQFKSGKVGIGESVKVYLYPFYKQNGSVQKAENIKYTASVAANAADYFSVTQSGSNPYCFEISAKGLKNGKSVAGSIMFTCGLNGKKAVFKATATNPVTAISTANENGLTRKSDHSFSIKASSTAKTSGTFELKPVCASSTDATTDKLKIYAMENENGYNEEKLKEGKVEIKSRRNSEQGRISMKAAADKKTVTVTAAKGAKPVTAYFLVVYNTVNDGAKKGYTVISVTVE